MSAAPVEATRKYATVVDDLPAAWSFVMRYLEEVGPRPLIEIRPLSIYNIHDIGDDDTVPDEKFEVVVSGMTKVTS